MAGVSIPRNQRTIPMIALVALFALRPVKAQAQNVRPIADAGLSRYAGPEPVVLDGTGSYDPDNSGTLSCTWRQISGPSVVIIDSKTATPTVAGSLQPDTSKDPTPTPQGFTQTNEIQECEFELLVNDGDLTSLSDTTKVFIVPDFGTTTLVQENPPFDPTRPLVIYFGGGDCVDGGIGQSARSQWLNWHDLANVISFPQGYRPDTISYESWHTYYHYGDMIIVYLSKIAPEYTQLIQTIGFSTGGQAALDVGIRLNRSYQDRRYAVNHVTQLDAPCRWFYQGMDFYKKANEIFLESAVDEEQCWIDHYWGDRFRLEDVPHNILGVYLEDHDHPDVWQWYWDSLMTHSANEFNHGIVAGVYWSVVGPGKNLQLSKDDVGHYFHWTNENEMALFHETEYPGRLPEPVTLIGPISTEDHNGVILSCEECENAVGYELLFGTDPYRVMDYEIISDTPAPPNDVITTLQNDGTWWTVRVRDQFGSTIYADPICLVANNPNPADGAMHPDTWANLSWNEGIRAASYDVYFGENFVDVQQGTAEVFRGNQTSTYFVVGYDGFPYSGGLVPGTTYFWRIDDVKANGTVMHKGGIWRFTVSPLIPSM